MSGRPICVFTATMASGGSTITSIDVTRSWSTIYADIQTMSTAAEIGVYGSYDGTTFKQVFERVNTAPVQYQGVVIATSVTGQLAPIPQAGRYLQFRASAVVSGGCIVRIICQD